MPRYFSVITALMFGLVLASPARVGYAEAVQDDVQQQKILADIKAAVVAATGYDAGSLELDATKVQLVLTVVNSKLVTGPPIERESEARRIVAAISDMVTAKSGFGAIQAIHVDYVTRGPDGGHTRVIDGIDFRKDPQGNFQHHMT